MAEYSTQSSGEIETILSQLIDNMDNDKVGLVVFAEATQLPITVDHVSAKMFLNSITPG